MKDTKKITFTAIFIALTFVFAYTPIGSIPIGPISFTTIFLPIAIALILVDDIRYNIVLGLSFGLIMFIKVIAPYPGASVLDPFFINPLISILPRFLVVIVGHFIYQGLKKIKNSYVRLTILGAIIPLLNTVFTLSSLFLISGSQVSEVMGLSIIVLLRTTLLCNALPELVLGAIVTPAIVTAIQKASKVNEEK